MIETRIAIWQVETSLHLPTIFAAATMMGISALSVGFPYQLMTEDFLDWFKLEAKILYDTLREPQSVVAQTIDISEMLQHEAAVGKINFLLPSSRFLMCRNIETTAGGFTGWGFSTYTNIYSRLSETVRGQLVQLVPGLRSAQNVKALLLPDAFCLIRDFDPNGWATSRRSRRISAEWKGIYPENLLWLQVTILDLAIRLQIRGSVTNMDRQAPEAENNTGTKEILPGRNIHNPEGEVQETPNIPNRVMKEPQKDKWDDPEVKVAHAIVKSWKDGAVVERLPTQNAQPTEQKASEPDIGGYNSQASAKPPGLAGGQVGKTLNWTDVGDPTQPKAETMAESKNLQRKAWNLDDALMKHAKINFTGSKAEIEFEYKRLAVLLKLRALFLIAFMSIGPDSSDVYKASDNDAELPIV